MAISCVAQTCVSWTAYTFSNSIQPPIFVYSIKIAFFHRLEVSNCCYLARAESHLLLFLNMVLAMGYGIHLLNFSTEQKIGKLKPVFVSKWTSAYTLHVHNQRSASEAHALGDNRWLSLSPVRFPHSLRALVGNRIKLTRLFGFGLLKNFPRFMIKFLYVFGNCRKWKSKNEAFGFILFIFATDYYVGLLFYWIKAHHFR